MGGGGKGTKRINETEMQLVLLASGRRVEPEHQVGASAFVNGAVVHSHERSRMVSVYVFTSMNLLL